MELLLNTIMLEPNRWSPDHELSRPLGDLLEPLQVAGFRDLEVWGYHVDRLDDAGVEALRTALQHRGQRVVAVGAYPAFHLEGAADEFETRRLAHIESVAVHLGARILKVFPGRVASADADEAIWRRSLARLKGLAARLAEHGRILTLETHGHTLCDTLDGTLRILDGLRDAGHVGVCLQPYAEHDTDQAMAFFDALADHVRHVHLQNRGPEREVTLLEAGDWTDYRRFLPHVRNAGFDGPLSLEFTAGITPPAGQAFDLSQVLANAIRDRRFVEDLWSAGP